MQKPIPLVWRKNRLLCSLNKCYLPVNTRRKCIEINEEYNFVCVFGALIVSLAAPIWDVMQCSQHCVTSQIAAEKETRALRDKDNFCKTN